MTDAAIASASAGDIPLVAVIVPYFQREHGILSRSIASALAQVDAPSYEIIVVDDGSPVPATGELRDLCAADRQRIRLIEQPNGGPGQARNAGLDAVRDGTRYVAFLDSDDVWFDHHLNDACFALEQGFDLYFSDLYHLDREESSFKRAGGIEYSEHSPLPDRQNLRVYRGDMIDQIITGNLIGTPTVVYRYAPFSTVRFRTEFRNAGEDYLFWLEIARRGAKFVFSSRPDTRCGRGVNVYSGAAWGSEEHLRRTHDEMRYRKATATLLPVTPQQVQVLNVKIADLRTAFVADILHRLTRFQRIPLGLMLRHAALDPMTFISFVPIALKILARRNR